MQQKVLVEDCLDACRPYGIVIVSCVILTCYECQFQTMLVFFNFVFHVAESLIESGFHCKVVASIVFLGLIFPLLNHVQFSPHLCGFFFFFSCFGFSDIQSIPFQSVFPHAIYSQSVVISDQTLVDDL